MSDVVRALIALLIASLRSSISSVIFPSVYRFAFCSAVRATPLA